MRLLAFLSHVAFLASLAYASRLPACSTYSVTPCSCPNGTTYQESGTIAMIGASATDVRSIIGTFTNPAWFGFLPYATTGADDTPGATRSYNFPTSIGQYNITEELTYFFTDPSGSFEWKFEQAPFNVPTEYHTHNGSFGGYWATMKSDALFQNETVVNWSAYLCATGHPLNFAEFQSGALNNAIKILTQQGKLTGQTIKPASVQSF